MIEKYLTNTNLYPRSSRMPNLNVVEHLPGTDYFSNLKTTYSNDPVSAESASRWVNRLKRSAPDLLDHCGKSSRLKIKESSPQEKIDYAPGETIDDNMMALEPRKDCTKAISSDQCLSLIKYSWIQRWLHNPASFPQKRHEALPITKSGNAEKKIDGLEKKQCPSIGAMALLGKALNGCWPFEFKKSGSLVIWNTRKV